MNNFVVKRSLSVPYGYGYVVGVTELWMTLISFAFWFTSLSLELEAWRRINS